MDKADRHTPDSADNMPARRFMLVLSYDGTPFNGWQIQPHDPSVQESIENALRIALRTPLHIVGAGRTDTGVNARHMAAHIDLVGLAAEKAATQPKQLLYTVNAILQPSIVVHSITEVDAQCHARFDATSRTYRYYIHTTGDPFREQRSRYVHRPLDFDAMNNAARFLVGTHDFTSFSKLHTDTKTNICTVTDAQWHKYGPGHYYFEITADRFLRNMVRAVVGTLLDIGTAKKNPDSIKQTLAAMNRSAAGSSVPGYALYLWQITYPYTLSTPPLPDSL